MNAILRKDLLSLLRLPRVTAIFLSFIAAMGILVVASWPQQGVVTLAAQGHDTLLLGLMLGQLIVLILTVPGMASTAVAGERESNTFEMLYASRLSPLQIVIGKVGSVATFPLMLLIAGLPFAALLLCRGDANIGRLAAAYGVLATSAVFLAIAALTISALCDQTATALFIAYVVLLILCGGVLLPAALLLPTQEGISAAVLHYLRSVSPVAAMLAILMPQPGDFDGREHGFWPAWAPFLGFAWTATLLCCLYLLRRLRQPPSDRRSPPSSALTGRRRSGWRRLIFRIDDPVRRRALGCFNPVIGNEPRINRIRAGRWLLRIFYGSLAMSLGLAVMSLYGGMENTDVLDHAAQVLVAFQIAMIALIGPSLTSGSISGEIETGTLETLQTTLLRPGMIYWGKLLSALPPAFLPVLALIPAYGAICYINPAYLLIVARLLPVCVMSVGFCCALGLACSSVTRNTARATVVAYLVVVIVFVLPLLARWTSGVVLDATVARWLWLPSPLAISMDVLSRSAAMLTPPLAGHLVWMGIACLILVMISRLRLSALLRA